MKKLILDEFKNVVKTGDIFCIDYSNQSIQALYKLDAPLDSIYTAKLTCDFTIIYHFHTPFIGRSFKTYSLLNNFNELFILTWKDVANLDNRIVSIIKDWYPDHQLDMYLNSIIYQQQEEEIP